MKISTLFLVLALAVAAAFAALNWPTFNQATTLSLGFTNVTAPLGLIMLGLLVAVSVLFLAYLVTLQTSVLLETRRHARELQAHRALADQAEASRFTELRKFIEGELQARGTHEAEMHVTLLSRMDRLDESVRGSLQDANNTVAAYMGELESRLAPLPPGATPERIIRREH
ncbi:LapA family protein [Janthinobacterium sp. 17J80-10]|uniref:LapA family protein n=1 Tax=Janthinobacterium sp. 17J80-10 TaxID=2497863 RepID=UPI00100577C2|nr:LapA family protein [Janthinobacterium sp. 17J80-10]QAU33058.1 LapA family protein [Janthinobacterium sp. 17J80-10]